MKTILHNFFELNKRNLNFNIIFPFSINNTGIYFWWWIEIGPGKGVLTKTLYNDENVNLVVSEIDRDLVGLSGKDGGLIRAKKMVGEGKNKNFDFKINKSPYNFL